MRHVGEIAGVEPAAGIRAVPLRPLEIAAEIRAGRTRSLPISPAGSGIAVAVDHLHLDARKRAAVGRRGELVVVVELDERDGAVFRHAPRRNDLGAEADLGLFDERAGIGARAQERLQDRDRLAALGHDAREIGEERSRRHREAGFLGADQVDGARRFPHRPAGRRSPSA